MSYKDKEWLFNEYHEQRRSRDEIAEQCGVSRRTISYFIQKYDIPKPCHEYDLSVDIACSRCKGKTSKRLKYLKQRIRKGETKFYCDECVTKHQSELLAGENNPNYGGEWHGPSDAGIKGLLSQMSGKRTKIEVKMANELNARGIEYIEQYNLGNKFALDFFLPEYGIVIECDGDYWHRLPKTMARDLSKNAYIKACGFSLYRFWESEINADVEACVDVILAEINAKEAM